MTDVFLGLCYGYSDDEDDTAELLAELERIKKERAEDKARKVHLKPFGYFSVALFFYMCYNEEVAERRIGWLCMVHNFLDMSVNF